MVRILSLLFVAGFCWTAAAQDIGTRAPPLSGVSGDGRELSDALIAGKVAMIWYEDRDSKTLNEDAESAAQSLDQAVRGDAARAPRTTRGDRDRRHLGRFLALHRDREEEAPRGLA
jgi:hypothetical protein